MDTQVFDIHIIGGGIIGLCAAVTLQSRGVKVAILEADNATTDDMYIKHLCVHESLAFLTLLSNDWLLLRSYTNWYL